MAQAQAGNKVKVHYTGRLDDNSIFDSSEGNDPLEFIVGQGQVIDGFDQAVLGLETGQSTTVHIEPENAYGERREQLIFVIDRKELPIDIDPQPNQRFQMRNEAGQELVVTVTDVSDNTVTFDGNHPLAGKALTFDIQLVEVT